MKNQNRVSQLTLELYHRGLATRKERKQVEKALLSDLKVRERYDALKEQYSGINQLNMPPAAPLGANVVFGLIAAAAVLVAALVPVFLHLKNRSTKNENAMAESPAESQPEETAPKTETPETIVITDNAPVDEKPSPPAPQPIKEKRGPAEKPKIAESPQPVPPKENESKPDLSVSYTVTLVPETDAEARMRGQNSGQQTDAATPSAQETDDGIPPGLTFIFENMFAGRFMVGIVIPERIKSIAKNAYAGNPVLIVTIGANVDVHEEAIPGNFAKAYNANGKAAGVYTRPNNNSEEWTKGFFTDKEE